MDDRPRRADARRNYERVLAAAREVFGELGVSAPLDEIARRAGVGNATMYRHFPTRRELVIAVYADEVSTLCELGRSLPADSSPADALFRWLRAFITHVATKRELPLAIPDDTAGQRSALYRQWHDTMRATASALLSRAQDADEIRSNLDVSDLLASASGIGHAAADDDQIDRLLAIVREGVTTPTRPSKANHVSGVLGWGECPLSDTADKRSVFNRRRQTPIIYSVRRSSGPMPFVSAVIDVARPWQYTP